MSSRVRRTCATRQPRSPRADTRGSDDHHGSRAGRDAARPRARRDARRPARSQPAGRLRAARRRRRATVAEGYHRGAGTPHAEADALARAGDARPRHHRRRDPRALQPHRPHRPVRAGAGRRRRTTGRVRPARPEPGRGRGSGDPPRAPASRSRPGCWRTRRAQLNRVWTFAVEHGRPFVTWKFATTLDGRSAAADGTSRWVSSRAARDRHPPAPRAVRRDAGRHQHGRRRRPAAHRPRRARPAARRTSRCAR